MLNLSRLGFNINGRRMVKYFLTLFIVNLVLFADSGFIELPIGLTEEEKGKLHIISEMGRETSPPQSPVRNIAEFEPMQGVLIRYPFGISTSLIREMAEDVIIYCLVSSNSQSSAFSSMNNAGVNMENVEFINGSTDSYWTRDYGPWWIVDGNNEIGIVDFTYNRPRPNDNNAPFKVSNHLNIPYFSADIISTGGNYMTDGYGISAAAHIAYTENNECNTNNESSVPLPHCAYVDNIMEQYYGINTYHVVADPNNEYIDHIDCWGKYLSPHKVLIREVPTWHSQYDEIEQIAEYFTNTQTIYGELWEVFRIYTGSDQPYTNSLILNEKVLVPIMNNSYDDDALAVYQEAMPGYEVIGFTGSWQSTDALHCRVKGIPDVNMIQIFHNPINDQIEIQDVFMVEAIIKNLNNVELIEEELKVVWWTDNMDESESVVMNVCQLDNPDCYFANIPSQIEDGIIKYYIRVLDETGKFARLPMAGYYSFSFLGSDLYDLGDLNQDGIINILDIVSMVNIVLDSQQNTSADLNNDGVINILDVILLVNIVLEN